MLSTALSLRFKEFGSEIEVTLHAFVCMYFHYLRVSLLCTCICDLGVGADSFCPLYIPVMTADGRVATCQL